MKKEIRNFYDLKVWQDAHNITIKIYAITKIFPKDEQFGLISQMRRSASSIGANIAEGFGRFYFKEKIKFYQQARASAVELQNHILLSKDLEYIKKDKNDELLHECNVVIKELNGLMRATNDLCNLNISSSH